MATHLLKWKQSYHLGGWGDGGDIWIDDDLSVEKSLLRNMKIFLVCTYSVNGIRTFGIYRQAQGQQYWHIDNLKHPKLIPKVHPVSMHTLVKSFPCHNITILPKLYHTIILKYICHKLCYRYTEVQCTITCECTLVNSSPNRPLLLRGPRVPDSNDWFSQRASDNKYVWIENILILHKHGYANIDISHH